MGCNTQYLEEIIVPSSRKIDARRRIFLSLAGQIESQLREAYDRKFCAGVATQSSLAKKLGIDRSAIHHRLMGHTNMTIETIADMVWALDHDIVVNIFDPFAVSDGTNYQSAVVGELPTIDSALDRVAEPKKAMSALSAYVSNQKVSSRGAKSALESARL